MPPRFGSESTGKQAQFYAKARETQDVQYVTIYLD